MNSSKNGVNSARSHCQNLVSLMVCLLATPVAHACTIAQRADFAKAGYTKAEIESMCSGSPTNNAPQTVSQGGADRGKFDYKGAWRTVACEAMINSKTFRQLGEDECPKSQWPGTFTISDNLFNKSTRIKQPFQEDDILLIETFESFLNFPRKYVILDNNTMREVIIIRNGPRDKVTYKGESVTYKYARVMPDQATQPATSQAVSTVSNETQNTQSFPSSCTELLSFNRDIPNSDATCTVLDKDISDRYQGECKDGLAHGKGIAKGGEIYAGEFVSGKKNGYGVYVTKAGNCIEINFTEDKANGDGLFRLKNGTTNKVTYKMGVLQSLLNPASWFSK